MANNNNILSLAVLGALVALAIRSGSKQEGASDSAEDGPIGASDGGRRGDVPPRTGPFAVPGVFTPPRTDPFAVPGVFTPPIDSRAAHNPSLSPEPQGGSRGDGTIEPIVMFAPYPHASSSPAPPYETKL